MPTGPKRPADSFPSPMGRGGLFFERVGTKLYHYRESASLEICTGALACEVGAPAAIVLREPVRGDRSRFSLMRRSSI